MDNAHVITRRSLLSRLPIAAVAVSAPLLATTHALAASPLPGLVEAFRAADAASNAAQEVCERIESAFNRVRPRYYADTPGIGMVDAEMIGPAGVRKLYADDGPRLLRKGLDPEALLAVALDNHDKAWMRIEADKVAAGVTGANEALTSAVERQRSAFMAILEHVPVSRADAADKVAFLLSLYDDDPYFPFTPDELRAVFASFASGA